MNRTSVDISIVVVSHGHDDMLPDCVNSISRAAQGLSCEVIIVDNLNQGRIPSLLAQAPIPCTFKHNQKPQGFAANVNQGAAAARGRYLLILNPDTRFNTGRLLDAIKFIEDHPSVGLLACRLLNADGTTQRSFRRFPSVSVMAARGLAADRWPWRPRFYRNKMMENREPTSPIQVDWVFGACMLINKNLFTTLGGMDEKFRLYYEDVDLCYRIRQHGLGVWYFPEITIFHDHPRASASRPFSKLWRWHVASGFRYFFLKRR